MLEAALFSRKLASNYEYFYFVLHFIFDPGPNSVPEPQTKMHYGSSSTVAKSCGSCGSGSGSGSTTPV
jgi:hypothetical protein